MLNKIAKAGLYALALVLIGWTGYRTTHLLQLTTDNPVVPYLGLAVFDGGLLVWTYYFLHGAEGTAQRAVALSGGLLNLVLVALATAADVWLGGQTLVSVAPDYGTLALWLVAGATALNLALMWLAHVTEPAVIREMRLRDAKDKILEEAHRQLKLKTDEVAAQVADVVASEMVGDAVRALIGNRRPGETARPASHQLPSAPVMAYNAAPPAQEPALQAQPVTVPPTPAASRNGSGRKPKEDAAGPKSPDR